MSSLSPSITFILFNPDLKRTFSAILPSIDSSSIHELEAAQWYLVLVFHFSFYFSTCCRLNCGLAASFLWHDKYFFGWLVEDPRTYTSLDSERALELVGQRVINSVIYSQCWCQGLKARGQEQGQGIVVQGPGQGFVVRGQGQGLVVRRQGHGQGLVNWSLKIL